MTDDELTAKLNASFGRCPHCGSENISASAGDGGRVYSMPVECEDCGESWFEHYRFESASNE